MLKNLTLKSAVFIQSKIYSKKIYSENEVKFSTRKLFLKEINCSEFYKERKIPPDAETISLTNIFH